MVAPLHSSGGPLFWELRVKITGRNPFYDGWLDAYLGLERRLTKDGKGMVNDQYASGYDTLMESGGDYRRLRYAMAGSIKQGHIVVERD